MRTSEATAGDGVRSSLFAAPATSRDVSGRLRPVATGQSGPCELATRHRQDHLLGRPGSRRRLDDGRRSTVDERQTAVASLARDDRPIGDQSGARRFSPPFAGVPSRPVPRSSASSGASRRTRRPSRRLRRARRHSARCQTRSARRSATSFGIAAAVGASRCYRPLPSLRRTPRSCTRVGSGCRGAGPSVPSGEQRASQRAMRSTRRARHDQALSPSVSSSVPVVGSRHASEDRLLPQRLRPLAGLVAVLGEWRGGAPGPRRRPGRDDVGRPHATGFKTSGALSSVSPDACSGDMGPPGLEPGTYRL